MPPRKDGKQPVVKASVSATPAASIADKQRRATDTKVPLRETDGPIQKRLAKAEEKRFKRFQKGAKKAGLLVSRKAYDLYFRDHLAD